MFGQFVSITEYQFAEIGMLPNTLYHFLTDGKRFPVREIDRLEIRKFCCHSLLVIRVTGMAK